MATYNPYQRGTVGQMAFTGQLQGIRQKALDLEAIEDYISGSSRRLRDATASSSKSGALSRLLGFGASAAGKKLLALGNPQAMILGAAVSGLSRFLGSRKTKKQTKNIGSNAPQVLYGKKQLRRAQEKIDENVDFFQNAPIPQALTSAFQTLGDVYKFNALQSTLAKEAAKEVGKEVVTKTAGEVGTSLSRERLLDMLSNTSSPMYSLPVMNQMSTPTGNPFNPNRIIRNIGY